MQSACRWGALCPPPPNGCSGLQSACRLHRHAAACERIVCRRRRVCSGLQSACKLHAGWARCVHRRRRRRSGMQAGHAGGLCKLPQKNQPNVKNFRTNLGDGFAGRKPANGGKKCTNRVQRTLLDPPRLPKKNQPNLVDFSAEFWAPICA